MLPLAEFITRLRRLMSRRSGTAVAPPLDEPESWKVATADELDFWRAVILDPDHPYASDIPWRLSPHSPLQEYLKDLVPIAEGERVAILDVGAGPVSMVGKSWPGRSVHLVAIDPLADRYNAWIAERGLVPYVRTQTGFAERLTQLFAPETFDIVFSHNALDHSFAPMDALQQAMTVLKPGGWIYLRHNIDEAQHAGYGGLHQWNFTEDGGKFVIWNADGRCVVEEQLVGVTEARVSRWLHPGSGRMMVNAAFRKG